MAKVTGASTWTVVGSHDPALSVPVVPGILGNNWVSVPYHTTCVNADDLKTEVTGQGISVTRIYRWDTTVEDYEFYQDTRTGVNFAINPGIGYMLKTTGAGNWDPSHY
jgi:hypothetical protein